MNIYYVLFKPKLEWEFIRQQQIEVSITDTIQYSSPQHTYVIELNKVCTDVTGKSGKGRRTANRIHDLIEVRIHDNINLEGARNSILDQ